MIRLNEAERALAAELLSELSEHRLCVELMPAQRQIFTGHMVRVVTDYNPSWYSRLWRSFPMKSRRTLRHRRRNSPDSDLRRSRVEAALTRMADRGVARTAYDRLLLPLVRRASGPHHTPR